MASDNSRRAARFGRLSTDARVPADQQSVIPGVPGVPWWGAVLIAAVLTAIGATADALVNSSLGLLYNLFFLFGCVVAALAVRRRALFTAAVQPPLISLCIGLTSLWGMAQAASTNNRPQGMRQVVLNVALPFSNLFPWIAGVFLATLLVVLVRWFLTRDAVAAAKGAPVKGVRPAEAERSKKTKTASTKTKTGKNTTAKNTTAATTRKRPAKPTTAKSDATRPTTANGKAATAVSGNRKPGKPRPAQPESRDPRAEAAGQRRPARRPATGEQPRPDQTRPAAPRPDPARPVDPHSAEPSPEHPRPERPRPAEPSPEPPRPEPAHPDQAASPSRATQRAPSGGTTAPGPRPVRKAPTVVGQTSERPVRRAAPQVIPPRPGTDRPRRTAGQSLREQGAVEDLTLGLDD